MELKVGDKVVFEIRYTTIDDDSITIDDIVAETLKGTVEKSRDTIFVRGENRQIYDIGGLELENEHYEH